MRDKHTFTHIHRWPMAPSVSTTGAESRHDCQTILHGMSSTNHVKTNIQNDIISHNHHDHDQYHVYTVKLTAFLNCCHFHITVSCFPLLDGSVLCIFESVSKSTALHKCSKHDTQNCLARTSWTSITSGFCNCPLRRIQVGLLELKTATAHHL